MIEPTGMIQNDVADKKRYFLSIFQWTLIGLLIRILVMPFTMDIDMFWINYLPHQLVNNGTWDIYSFARDNFWSRIGESNNPYYPPFTLFIISFFQFLFKSFMPTLTMWFKNYETLLHMGGGMFLQHIILPPSDQIFRNLFFLKIPLLIFDLSIGLLLLKILKYKNKDSLLAYKLWMLNPVTIYAVFGYGQIDIYPTFFVVLSLWLANCKKPYLSMVCLGLGALTKSYPLILMPLAVIFLNRRLYGQIKLLLTGLGTILIFYIPFLISSGGYSLTSLFPGGTIGTGFNWSMKSVLFRAFFVIGYIILLINIMFSRNRNNIPTFRLETYFLIILLFFFSLQPVSERFYVWITPLLVLEVLRDKKLFFLIFFQLLALVLLRFQSAEQWAGIFSPLNPAYFMSRQFTYHFIAPFFSIIDLQRIAYRLFIILTLLMIYRIIRNNLKFTNDYVY